MPILAIETSTRAPSVALWAPPDGEWELAMPPGHSLARWLIPAVSQLLDQSGMRKGQVTRIAVSQGPGSFTGLRVGLTAAKMLAYSLRIPLQGVNSLQVLVQQTQGTFPRLWTLLDGQRGDFVTAAWSNPTMSTADSAKVTAVPGSNEWRSLEPTRLVSRDDWLSQLVEGDAVLPCELKSIPPLGPHINLLPTSHPRALDAARLVAPWPFPDNLEETWNLPLIYYRPSAAEEKREAEA